MGGPRDCNDIAPWACSHIGSFAQGSLRKRDFSFCEQAQRAANGACRNIAEGFGRYQHTEFGRFVVIARGSLYELLDTLDEALLKHYLTRDQYEILEKQIQTAIRSVSALRTYLQSTPTPRTKSRAQDTEP